jgi:hypothetical protein
MKIDGEGGMVYGERGEEEIEGEGTKEWRE